METAMGTLDTTSVTERLPVIEKIKESLSDEELESATRSLTVMDAMRLGSQHTNQATGCFGRGEEACANSAAALAAKALGWLD